MHAFSFPSLLSKLYFHAFYRFSFFGSGKENWRIVETKVFVSFDRDSGTVRGRIMFTLTLRPSECFGLGLRLGLGLGAGLGP